MAVRSLIAQPYLALIHCSCSENLSDSMTLVLVSLWSVGIAVSVIYLRYGTLYLGYKVHNLEQESWFSTTEYGCKSLAITFAIEFVIRFALSNWVKALISLAIWSSGW